MVPQEEVTQDDDELEFEDLDGGEAETAPPPAEADEKTDKGVTLENRTRQMQVYNLTHPEALHSKRLAFLQSTLTKRGERAYKRVAKSVPDALTFTARGTAGSRIPGLPDTILACPEIAAALKRGDLRKIS